jgi:hypothetical protein
MKLTKARLIWESIPLSKLNEKVNQVIKMIL